MTAEERLLEKFYERLSVYQVEKSRVIAIEFRSANPMLAAEVANAVAERLLVFQQKAKQESMRQASHWLSGEIDQLRKRVAETEARADEFRSKSNLFIGSNNTSLSGQQLGEANSQLVQARAQKAEAEAKARVIRDMLRSGRPIEASDIVNSEVIRRLNDQRVTLKAQLAEQSSTLLDQHPRIKELKAQIADIEAQTRSEAEKFVRSLDNDARIASARLDTLSANLDQAKKQASALSVDDVQLRALEREAKSQRDLLESYLARYRDVTAREGPDAVPPDARVLSQAVPSPAPYFPKKLPIILIAMLAVMLCTAIFVALAELMSLDGTRRAAIPMADAMPAPVSSPVPASWIGAASDAPAGRPEPTTKTNERRLAAIAEHVRGLGRGVVAVTAADEEEPGSAVALDLAREIGRQGARVLLVDMDVAESSTASLVADPRAPGLADLVFGVASFGEVIQRDRASRIHLIAVGRGVRDADALLAGERLAVIIGAVSQTYDHVIIAVPPLGSVARAERLARFTRGVVLLVAKGGEGAGAASSDMLAARGFSNIVVVSVMKDAPDTNPDRAAA
jgi:polysaccharide biosynthesis transport protein